MTETGQHWVTLSLRDLVEYRAHLYANTKYSLLEVETRVEVISNFVSQMFRTESRLYAGDDVPVWFQSANAALEKIVRQTYLPEVEYPRDLSHDELREFFLRLKERLASAPLTEQSQEQQYLLAEADTLLDALLEVVGDDGYLRLTSKQASLLINKPGLDTPRGLRDTLVIALFLVTGIREAELQALDVADLYYPFQGSLALRVPNVPGGTPRLVPYGIMGWVVDIAEQWLETANIENGPLLRGFYRDGVSVRPSRLGLRSIRLILDQYPIQLDDGREVTLTPLDLRRTYARRLYTAGMDLGALQENLGVADINTVLDYVGKRRTLERLPPGVYWFGTEDWPWEDAPDEEDMPEMP